MCDPAWPKETCAQRTGLQRFSTRSRDPRAPGQRSLADQTPPAECLALSPAAWPCSMPGSTQTAAVPVMLTVTVREDGQMACPHGRVEIARVSEGTKFSGGKQSIMHLKNSRRPARQRPCNLKKPRHLDLVLVTGTEDRRISDSLR